ncbi:MAG: pseudouridine synthase [Candidatus Saccharimonadales bacterium]
MRINQYVAQSTGLSRRAADGLIGKSQVSVNGVVAERGYQVQPGDQVSLNGQAVNPPDQLQTLLLNKPVGYVCSRDGQGSPTIYQLIPRQFLHLKPIGRLDKDSSGLILMTDDGQLANQLSHPKYAKNKVYRVKLNKPLSSNAQKQISHGVKLIDGPSQLQLKPLDSQGLTWQVTMHEGRNRQIRRTFVAVGVTVATLQRIQLADFNLEQLGNKTYLLV